MTNERALSSSLKTSLQNGDPFLYAHLIKFERAVTTTTSKPARNARDYSYITDASYDIAWDDGSKNVKEQSNGSQTYRANRVSKIGTIAETVEAKASTMTLEISAESLSSKTDSGENVTITYSGTNAGDTVTLAITYTDWAELGFLEGDKITIKKSGHALHSKRAVIDSFSGDFKTITCTSIDAGSGSVTSDFVVHNSSDEYESLFYEEFEGTDENGAYAGYINREVFIYKAHINPLTGIVIGDPYLIFKGIIAKAKATEDPNKSSKVVWSLTSHWGDFVRVNGRLTSDTHHRALAGNGQVDQAALLRYEYGSDLGFMHAEKAINIIAIYQVMETRYKLKSSGWLFKRYKQVEYQVEVDRDVDLRFNLEAKHLPVVYGVQRVDSIPIFADTLKDDSSEVHVAYAICEGEIGGIYDIYIDDQSRICIDENDNDTRATQTADKSIDVICQGRMDRGDTLSSQPAFQKGGQYQYYMGNMWNFYGGFLNFLRTDFLQRTYGVADTGSPELQDALGVTHEKRTTIKYPIKGDFIFHAGRPNQRADDRMVQIATIGRTNGNNDTNSGFKLQHSEDDIDMYWTPNHRLLDTAYVTAKFEIGEGDTEIPDLDFVVRGREIEQYNYDYSYRYHPHSVQNAAALATQRAKQVFQSGRKVDIWNFAQTQVIAEDIVIAHTNLYKTGREEDIYKFRFQTYPLGTSNAKEFVMVPAGTTLSSSYATDYIQFATYDFASATGMIPSVVQITLWNSATLGTVARIYDNTDGDGGIDIELPAGEMRDLFAHSGDDIAINIAFLKATETPATEDIEKRLLYIQPAAYDSTSNRIKNVGNVTTTAGGEAAKPVDGDKLVVVNAVKLASGSSTDDYYQGLKINLKREQADGSMASQTQQIIKYDGGQKIALFGDTTPAATMSGEETTISLGVGVTLVALAGRNKGTTITFANTNATTTALTAIKAQIDSPNNKTVWPTEWSPFITHHDITAGTKINSVDVSAKTITYSEEISLSSSVPVRHAASAVGNVTLYQPGTGDFIPNTGDTYSILSEGDGKISINPAIQLLDYLISPTFGRGLDLEDDIDLESFKEAARQCDTRSDVTMMITPNEASNAAVGDIFKFEPTLADNSKKIYWQGTIKSITPRVSGVTGSTEVVFTDCIGKIATKFESWKTFTEGQLIWKYHPNLNINNGQFTEKYVLHQVPAGTTSYTGAALSHGTDVFSPINTRFGPKLDKVSGDGTASSMYIKAHYGSTSWAARNQVSADGNPIVKGWNSETNEPTDSGYSLYDSDQVKYWRYIGWQWPDQDEVTRHQCNTVLRTENPVFDNVNSLLKHFNGILRYSNGKYNLAVEKGIDNASFTANDVRKIDESEIIGAISVDDAGLKGSANSVSVDIPDPAIRYDKRSVTFFNSKYLKEDRGVPKKKDIKTPLISNYFNARINAEQYLVQSRSNKKINFKIGPQGVLLLAGTLIKVTYPRFGFDEKVFRITNLNYTADCLTQITAIEHDDDAYKITPKIGDGEIGNPPGPPGGTVISPPSALTVAGGVNEANLSWANALKATSKWKTLVLRGTSNQVANAEVVFETSSDQTTYKDKLQEHTADTTYYYWVRHTVIRATPPSAGKLIQSATIPSGGQSVVVTPSGVKNSHPVELYYVATSKPTGSTLPGSMSNFPNVTYNFTSAAVTGAPAASDITSDQIKLTTGATSGWYINPPVQGSNQAIYYVKGTAQGYTDSITIAPNAWSNTAYDFSTKEASDSDGIISTASNASHTFLMDSDGNVLANNWDTVFYIYKNGTRLTFDASSPYDNNSYNLTVAASGGVQTSEVNITSVNYNGSTQAQLTLAATADIIDTASSVQATIVVTITDNGNSNATLATHEIRLNKITMSTRNGATKTYVNSTYAADWADTSGDGLVSASTATGVAALVIADGTLPEDGGTYNNAGSTRIVPNDRITIKNGNTVATRIYTGAATTNSSGVSPSNWSTVVVNEVNGSMIVDGTLSANKLVSNAAITNGLQVNSVMSLGTSNSDANSKFYSYGKTDGIDDTSHGFYMDGSGDFSVGGSGGNLKFDASAGSLVFDGTFKIGGSTVNNNYIAGQAPVQSVNGATGTVSITAAGLNIVAGNVGGLGSVALLNAVALGTNTTGDYVSGITMPDGSNLTGAATLTANALNLSSANISDVVALSATEKSDFISIPASGTAVTAGKIVLTSGALTFTKSTVSTLDATGSYVVSNSILLDTTNNNNVIEIRDSGVVRVRIGKL